MEPEQSTCKCDNPNLGNADQPLFGCFGIQKQSKRNKILKIRENQISTLEILII